MTVTSKCLRHLYSSHLPRLDALPETEDTLPGQLLAIPEKYWIRFALEPGSEQRSHVRDALASMALESVEFAEGNLVQIECGPMDIGDAERVAARFPEVLITAAHPVYQDQERTTLAWPIPGSLIVRLHGNTGVTETIEQIESIGLRWDAWLSRMVAPYHYFTCRRGSSLSTRWPENIQRLRELQGVQSVEFDWATPGAFSGIEATESQEPDHDFASSWNLRRIGLPRLGELVPPEERVSIAVVDSGFDLGHPSLNYVDRIDHFDAALYVKRRYRGFRQRPLAPYDAGPTSKPHGTAVAGIAAAKPRFIDHRGHVVQGVAAGFPILPVRIGLIPTSAQVAASIRWSVARGARVINMSFKIANSGVVAMALEEAYRRHVVVCAATGNYTTEFPGHQVDFPASNSTVIGVGAIDRRDRRKNLSSGHIRDWGSQYGRGLDVVAPGVDVPTLDERDERGYRPGDYSLKSIGTSVACPHVAGLAALMLSTTQSTPARECKEVMANTCDRISPYVFRSISRSLPGWSTEVGHGLINVRRALGRLGSDLT